MISLALALWLAPPTTTPPPAPFGRVLTTRTVHVGVRPHFYASPGEAAGAVTIQLTFLNVL